MEIKPPEKRQPKKIHTHFTEQVPTVHADALVSDVEKLLLDSAKKFDTINYVYVLDSERKLKGVISIKDVFHQPKAMPVSRFMKTAIITAHTSTAPNQIAYTALRHNIKAVPVVTKENVFQGVVTSDTILKTLYHKMSEDFFRFAGAPGAQRHQTPYDDIVHLSLFRSMFHRLPWLLGGLCGGMMIAKVVGSFEALLSEHIILASFMPLVIYMADAVGTQANAFIIRDLATVPKLRFFAYFIHELRNDVSIGFITSIILFIAISWLGYPMVVAGAVACALFVAVSSAIGTGLVVPYVLSRLRIDPANGTGPMATILQDAMSVAIYFMIASFFF